MTLGGQLFAGNRGAAVLIAALLLLPVSDMNSAAAQQPAATSTSQPALLSAPAASAAAAAAVTATPEGVIRHIAIEGTQRVEPATVATYLLVHEGDQYNAAVADRSLKALFATSLFADVRMNWDGATLTIRVVENPIINQVVFEGNSRLSEKDLTKEVQIKPRTVFTRSKVQADVQRIVELYRRSGSFSASVDPKIIQRPQNRVDLVFEINEGPTTGIARINFIGNKVYDDSELRDQIVTEESAWWRFLSSNDNYDPDRLTFDREQLRRFYLKHGYADFRVVSAVAELTPDRSSFFVTFTVEEGQQYNFGKISIDSQIKELNSAELMPLVKTVQGETYNADQIDKTVEALTLAAGTKGYVFIDIHPRIQRNKMGHALDITYRIEPGPRVYVEKINIVGNTRTLDRVIRREFRLSEGDAFNRVLTDRSRTRIRALGFFKDVDIKETPGSAPDRTVLTVTVKEQPTGQLSVGAGYSSQAQFLGQVSYTERNLFGRGQYLQASISYSTIQQQYDFAFTDPYFMDRPLAAGFNLYRVQTNFTQGDYLSTSTGIGFLLGFPVSEYGRFTPRYTYKIDELTATSGAPLAIQLSQGSATASLVGYTYSYDTRDDPLKPTTGLLFLINQDIAGFGGSLKYLKSESRFTIYHDLFDEDWIGSLTFRGGYITGYDGSRVRINDRFFEGASSFRGFAIAGVGPRQTTTCIPQTSNTGEVTCIPGTTGQKAALGGQAYAIGTAEVRIPDFLPADYGMGFSLFSDFGTVGIVPGSHGPCLDTGCIHDNLALRASAGFTVRWKSPFGPVQIDIGYPFLKQPFDKMQTINFSAGTTF